MRLPRALAIVGRSFYDLWDNIFVLIVANLVWTISLLPALLFALLPISYLTLFIAVVVLLTIFTGPVVMAVYSITADVTRLEKLELRSLWRAIKMYWLRGMLLVGLNIAALIIFAMDMLFYGSVSASNIVGIFVLTLSFLAYFVWLMMQLFVFPLAVRSQTSLVVLYRNALIATFKYPSLSLPLLLSVVVLALLASVTIVVMMLFGFSLLALISNRALSAILEREAEQTAATRQDDSTALSALAAEEAKAGAAWSADPLQPALTTQSKDAQSIAASGVRQRYIPPPR